ncbi:max dimerization protein 3 isoform X1 [Passer domesticus]|uniref:max dimerization protein 3 isoform X1 n=1 Tax=Passer domesticus TaxID=48849 RepID=UPI0030FE1410
MEPAGSSIQVLLQAAEFLEHRQPRHPPPPPPGPEHGYAALCPAPPRRAAGSVRSVHNALEKHRRAQLRCCLERLKQQVPLGVGPTRSTTLSLLHRARLHIQRLEEQELRARRAKDRLRDRQRSLQRRLESLLLPTDGERARADSLDSSQLSEPSEEGWTGPATEALPHAGRKMRKMSPAFLTPARQGTSHRGTTGT